MCRKPVSPYCLNDGGSDADVATDNGHTMEPRCCSDDAVWKIGNLLAGNLPHRYDDAGVERNLLENHFRIGNCRKKVVQGSSGDALFLDQIDHLCETDC